MIDIKLDTKALEILDEIDKQKVLSQNGRKRPACSKELKEYFEDADTKPKRDSIIINAIEDGYTQAEVAKHLKVSRSSICKIVKSEFSTPDP